MTSPSEKVATITTRSARKAGLRRRLPREHVGFVASRSSGNAVGSEAASVPFDRAGLAPSDMGAADSRQKFHGEFARAT